MSIREYTRVYRASSFASSVCHSRRTAAVRRRLCVRLEVGGINRRSNRAHFRIARDTNRHEYCNTTQEGMREEERGEE
jgi:hypothetical protein